MKRSLVGFVILNCICFFVSAQSASYKQAETIGIHFLFNDFATAADIRNSSLSAVLNNKRFGKLKDMQQGLAITYGKGISDYFDFVSMLAGSFLKYPVPGREQESNEALFFAGDVSVRGKMFSDHYWFVPFLQVGAGILKYKGYWGTYIPAGVGVQINFFDEAYLVINSQYRIAVSESASYHFVHSVGLVGNIGKRD